MGDDASEPVHSVAELVVPVIANTNTDRHLDFQFSAFPQFSIPKSGVLKRWLFVAQPASSLTSNVVSLQLQIWRETENVLVRTFRLVHSTNVTLNRQGVVRGERLGTWEVTLQKPIPVEAGDILGFQQLSSYLQLALQPGSSVPVHELSLVHTDPFILTESNVNTSDMAAPLMAAEVQQGQ